MNTTRIGKRRNIRGDDLDEDYLKGEPNYIGIFLVIVTLVVLALIFYPK